MKNMKKLVLFGLLGGLALGLDLVGWASGGLFVTLNIEPDQVRFAVQGVAVQEIQVQVSSLRGERLFDSGPQSCAELAWPRLNAEGQRVANGVYLYALTVRDSEGKLVRKLGKLALLGSSGRQRLVQSSPAAGPQNATSGFCLARVSQNRVGALLVQALADAQVQQLRQQLEAQGLRPNLDAAKAFSGSFLTFVSIPLFGSRVDLYYIRTPQGRSNAEAVTLQGRRRIHQQADGSIRSFLVLNSDQVTGVIQQVRDVLRQHGIYQGQVRAAIYEERREALLSVTNDGQNHMLTLEALSWAESGAVTVGRVKQGPVRLRLTCGTEAAASNKSAYSILTKCYECYIACGTGLEPQSKIDKKDNRMSPSCGGGGGGSPGSMPTDPCRIFCWGGLCWQVCF